MKTVAKFDRNGFYAGVIELEQAPGGGHHIPNDCLDMEIEAQENKIAKRVGSEIEWVDDFRGADVYDTETGKKIRITAPGPR